MIIVRQRQIGMSWDGDTYFCVWARARETYARPVFLREMGERTFARRISLLPFSLHHVDQR